MALLVTSALSTPAFAQQYSPPGTPPIRETVDQNGVDLVSGNILAGVHSISIGPPGAAGMSWSRTLTGSANGWRDSTAIILSVSGSSYTMSVGGASESFTLTGSDYVSDQKTGSTLSVTGTTYTYTTADGTIITLDPYVGFKRQYRGDYRVSSVTYPTGEKLTFNWEVVDGVCVPNVHQPDGCNRVDGERLRSVTATNGYKLQFTFQTEDPASAGPGSGWATIATVVAQNMSVDSAHQAWPTLTFTGSQLTSPITITDSLNRTTTYTFSGGVLGTIKRPGASSDNESVGYTSGLVSQVNKKVVSQFENRAD